MECHKQRPIFCIEEFYPSFETAINLKERLLSLSDPTFHSSIMDELENLLSENGYPYDFIKRVLNFKKTDIDMNMVGKHGRRYFSLPYVGQSSVIIKKFLEKLDPKLCIAFENCNTLDTQIFSRTKDKILQYKKSGVAYGIPCSGCSKYYVGETCQFRLL